MVDIKTKALRAHSEGQLSKQNTCIGLSLNGMMTLTLQSTRSTAQSGRLQEGSSHYHRSLERWPGSRELILNMQLLEKTEKTQSHCTGCKLHCGTDDRQLTEALAEALAFAGMTAEAVRHYELILKKDPTRLQSWMGLGLVHARAGQLQEQGQLPKGSVD